MGKTKELIEYDPNDYDLDYIRQIEIYEQEYYATIAHYNKE